MFYMDPLYLMIIAPVMILSFWAHFKVKRSFAVYSRQGARSGLTGAQAAAAILEQNGIHNVPVEPASGFLSDHYSPRERVIHLSQDVYRSNSIAAVAVAAHEAGHAIQHHKASAIFSLWQALAVPAGFASSASIWLIMIGMIIGALGLARIGFYLFAVTTVFQFVTLPLEFDASNKAKRLLLDSGMISQNEKKGVAAVLNSAALTYVAAAASSVATLLYYAMRLGLFGGRDD